MATVPLGELSAMIVRFAEQVNTRSTGNPYLDALPADAAGKLTSGTSAWPRRLPRRLICDNSVSTPTWLSTSMREAK